MDITIGSIIDSLIRTIWLVPTIVDYFVFSTILIIFLYTVNYQIGPGTKTRTVLIMILIVFIINILQVFFGYHPSGLISMVEYFLLGYLLRISCSFS